MIDRVVLEGEDDAELFGNCVDLNHGARNPAPFFGIWFVGFGIFAETFGGVEIGIEGYADEMPVGGGIGHVLELLVGFFEIGVHAWAECGEWATGEDESESVGLPGEILQFDLLTEAVGERVIWHLVTDSQSFHLADDAGGGTGLLALGRGVDTCLFHAFDPAIIFGNNHAESYLVIGRETGEFVGVLDFEGHGHGRHEVRDFLVLNDDFIIGEANFLDNASNLKDLALAGRSGIGM